MNKYERIQAVAEHIAKLRRADHPTLSDMADAEMFVELYDLLRQIEVASEQT